MRLSIFFFYFFFLIPPPAPVLGRNPVEPVVLRAPEDGDHQPRPADDDQRGHHPPLGVGARAQRGLEAARRRVDHRLQEHLGLPQVTLHCHRLISGCLITWVVAHCDVLRLDILTENIKPVISLCREKKAAY